MRDVLINRSWFCFQHMSGKSGRHCCQGDEVPAFVTWRPKWTAMAAYQVHWYHWYTNMIHVQTVQPGQWMPSKKPWMLVNPFNMLFCLTWYTFCCTVVSILISGKVWKQLTGVLEGWSTLCCRWRFGDLLVAFSSAWWIYNPRVKLICVCWHSALRSHLVSCPTVTLAPRTATCRVQCWHPRLPGTVWVCSRLPGWWLRPRYWRLLKKSPSICTLLIGRIWTNFGPEPLLQLDLEFGTVCQLTSDSRTCHTAVLDSHWRCFYLGSGSALLTALYKNYYFYCVLLCHFNASKLP